MGQASLHEGLELRLETLAARIRMLREKMERTEGLKKIEEFGELDQLERRQKELEGRMQELDREGPSFRRDMKNELEKLSYDLSAAVEDFNMRIDSGF
ncbi:MAG: hypothetical protein ACLP7P_08865 [Rhodomicrobium sp.]